jgi:hypothetical protein
MCKVTVQTIAAERVKNAANALIVAVSATPEDKLHWKPMDCGRPVLNQAIECVFANMRWAATIRNRAFTHVSDGEIQAIKASFREEIEAGCWSGETVKNKLRDVTKELAEVILAVSDSDLTLPIPIPPPWQETYLLAECFNHPYWNMVYHLGQINYIQTLLGDAEDHSVF